MAPKKKKQLAADQGVEIAEGDDDDEEDDEDDEENQPKQGDKLYGWPGWVQGVEYPSCTKCSKPMELVMQLDSEDNIPFMYGDAGCAHLTQVRVKGKRKEGGGRQEEKGRRARQFF